MNKKTITGIVVVILISIVVLFLFWRAGTAPQNAVQNAVVDQKNATYIIEGQTVTLVNGSAETPATAGSAEKVATQYFGNETIGDFNGDGMPDIAFLLTQDPGGTGTFFYVAAALETASGYQGTNAILLGDRIAPQTTEFKNGMIIVNYAERAPSDPMTAQPSVGISKYFKIIDGKLIEIDLKMGEAEARTIAEKTCIKGGEALQGGIYNENSKTWWFDANLNSTKPGCNPACVVSAETKTAEVNWRCTGAILP